MIDTYSDGSVVAITGFVESISERFTKNRKKFVQLTLCQNGRSASCFLWNTTLTASKIEQNDVVKVKGQVKLYNGKKSLHISQHKKIEPTEELMKELMPHLPDEEIEAYKQEVNRLIA